MYHINTCDSEREAECDCEDCCFAPVGPQGVAGFQGVYEIGLQGFRGYQHATTYNYGFQGFQGIVGYLVAGPVGDVGFDGPLTSGSQGYRGTQGPIQFGPQGKIGDPGPQGFDGSFEIGPQGTQAQAGTQGPKGYTGPQAFTANGPQGPFGPPVFYNQVKPYKDPFTRVGFQSFSGNGEFALFTFSVGQYYEYMTVSVIATTSNPTTGDVFGSGAHYPFSMSAQGSTFVANSFYGEFQPSTSSTRKWYVNSNVPVTIYWTQTIYYSF